MSPRSHQGTFWSILGILVGTLVCAPLAGATVFLPTKTGDQLGIAGRIQVQYNQAAPDKWLLRRFRLTVTTPLKDGWRGKFQWDMGKNKLSVKDAYILYTGMPGHRVRIGHAKAPFSREFLTSSKKQQLVERTWVGDHDFGVPDRALGIHWKWHPKQASWTIALAGVIATLETQEGKVLKFGQSLSGNAGDEDGFLLGGRVDWGPQGPVSFDQGDFQRTFRWGIGLGAFTWRNGRDHGTAPSTPDRTTGLTGDLALRGAGLSVDLQYNRIQAKTVGSTFGEGLFRNGKTTLKAWAVEGGYMLLRDHLEGVAAYEVLDADGYDTAWTRTSLGLNLFLDKHRLKAQATYQWSHNQDGIKGDDVNTLWLQFQYVF